VYSADRPDLDGRRIEAVGRAAGFLSGEPHTCAPAADGDWGRHRLLPLYLSHRPPADVRRFVRDRLRWSPSLARSAFTALIAVVAGSRPGMRRLTTPSLRFRPALDESMVFQVGGTRVRGFDLRARRSVIVDLAGGPCTLAPERAARLVGDAGFFVPLAESQDTDGRGDRLVEVLVDGSSLARQPPWRRRRPVMELVLSELEQWAAPAAKPRAPRDYAGDLAGRLEQMAWPAAQRQVADLVGRTRPHGQVSIGPSHGDLQQANIIVENRGRPRVVDFEHFGHRSTAYDRAVLSTDARWMTFTDDRAGVEAFTAALARRLRSSTGLSDQEIAVVLLEELIWRGNRRTARGGGIDSFEWQRSTANPNSNSAITWPSSGAAGDSSPS
jgi:hypothetical protein